MILVVSVCHSQTLQPGWSSFDGSIGKSDIVVNIFLDSNGNLTGDYCYKKYETRIPLKGKIYEDTLILDEFVDGKINAKFKGKINEQTNTISGKWSSTTHSDIAFSLKLSSWIGGTIDNKYSLGKNNEEVESFFKKTKKAILTDDKTWLSKNIEYPLTTNLPKKRLKIRNAKEFLTHYNAIITNQLKKSIKESCVCDIFKNWQGAMIANGSIWISEFKNQLKIITINN